jgi:hypothetical protein
MMRMYDGKSPGQPPTTPLIQVWKYSGEVCLVLGTQRPGFVQQLNFWSKIRNPIIRHVSNGRERATDLCVATKEPLIIMYICDHELDGPRIGFLWTTPDIMDFRREECARFPFIIARSKVSSPHMSEHMGG